MIKTVKSKDKSATIQLIPLEHEDLQKVVGGSPGIIGILLAIQYRYKGTNPIPTEDPILELKNLIKQYSLL